MIPPWRPLHLDFGGIDIYLFDQLLRGRIASGMEILDAGCGAGRNLVQVLPFGASAGRADAKRREAGDVVTSSRSGNAADARPPPRPEGLPARELLISYPFPCLGLGLSDPAANCEVIFARA